MSVVKPGSIVDRQRQDAITTAVEAKQLKDGKEIIETNSHNKFQISKEKKTRRDQWGVLEKERKDQVKSSRPRGRANDEERKTTRALKSIVPPMPR